MFSGIIMLIGAEAAHGGLAGLECRLWGVSVRSFLDANQSEGAATDRRWRHCTIKSHDS